MRTHWIKSFTIGILLTGVLSGCATQSNKDPLEGLNRGIYKFNDTVDKAAVRPIAGAYKAVLPTPIRSGVNNFFSNLGTVITVINDLLQVKFSKAMDDAGRFAVNSTFGIAGLIDLASMDGMEKHNEDFGQTLGYWGVGDGPYLVLPLLGPSSVRDTAGLVMDGAFFDPIQYVDNVETRNYLLLTKFIDKRAQYLPGSDLLDEAALDPYIFMRDAYFQRRHNMIHDGDYPAGEHPRDESSEEESGSKILAEAPQRAK
jgi:phospholipid-binding lipoprotein MlaA